MKDQHCDAGGSADWISLSKVPLPVPTLPPAIQLPASIADKAVEDETHATLLVLAKASHNSHRSLGNYGGWCVLVQQAYSMPYAVGIPYGHPFMSQLLHFDPNLYLWPEKPAEDGPKLWDLAPTWETRKRSLTSDFRSV